MRNSAQTSLEPAVISLIMPCRFSVLDEIRQRVNDHSQRAGLREEHCAQLEMAVDEACTNIIEHSYGGESDAMDKNLRILLQRHPGRVVVEILDRGAGFDFHGHVEVSPEQWLDEERLRGLGMFIINHFVDAVAYERDPQSGNCLRLTKHIR